MAGCTHLLVHVEGTGQCQLCQPAIVFITFYLFSGVGGGHATVLRGQRTAWELVPVLPSWPGVCHVEQVALELGPLPPKCWNEQAGPTVPG